MQSVPPRDPEQLIEDAKNGRVECLDRLFDTYRNYLALIARTQIDRHMRGRVSPSDVVQEACLRAFDRFGQFRGSSEREWLGWLRRILANTLVHLAEKHLIAEKRDARREISLDRIVGGMDQTATRFEGALMHGGSSPSRQAERREIVAEIADRLAAMPDDYREVLVLRNLEGLSFEEVAQRMNRSSGAARMLWLRALDRLRGDQE